MAQETLHQSEKQVMRTVGLRKSTNDDTSKETRNDGVNDVRQVYEYEYTPKPKSVVQAKQSKKRRAVVIVKNRAAGKTVRDASIFSAGTKAANDDTRNDETVLASEDERTRINTDDSARATGTGEKEESEGLLSLAEKAFLKLGEFVGEGAVTASKNVGELMK
jgi:hypothetical protein